LETNIYSYTNDEYTNSNAMLAVATYLLSFVSHVISSSHY